MRIAHLVNSLILAGAEQVTASLATSQRRRGHDVWIICLRDFGSPSLDIPALSERGIRVVALGKPSGLHFRTLTKLASLIKKERIEVLHTHNHLVHHYGAAAALWARVPAVLNTLHGTLSLQSSAQWTKALFWLSCLPTDRVVCVGHQVRETMEQTNLVPRGRLCVIENGIDLSRFLAINRRPAGRILTFGNIGRLDSVKGQDVLLRAFAAVHKQNPNIRLRVLGDGPMRQDLLELAANLSLRNEVSFEGASLDTPSFLRGIDVYVLSSRSEGLPLAVLEAMAAGLPVVATEVGGVPMLVQQAQCGWLCAPADAEGLAQAMRHALEAPDLGAMGERARAVVAKSYSVECMSGGYEKLYEELRRSQA